MRRRAGSIVVLGLVALVLVLTVGTAAPAAAWAGAGSPARGARAEDAVPVTYRPPVDAAPLVDTFRPPATDYGAGNRGVDYGTTPGQAVVAAAAGEVVFAGAVGDSRHVVVLHADGLRTSYSFLASTTVRRGQRVSPGDPVGTAGAGRPVHFGVRAGETYLDPLVLLGQRAPGPGGTVRLVADPDERRPLREAVERRRLLEMLRAAAGDAARWARVRAADAVERKVALARVLADSAGDLAVPLPVDLALAALRWQDEQARCTPTGTPVPAAPGAGRLVVLVGGLGSATGDSAVLAVRTAELGYDQRDVHAFTYADDPSRPYVPADTLGDIGAAGARLAAQLERLRAAHPGVPIDVIAHSQGGLVARSAITTHGATPDTVVTLGTPHQGAELATAAVAVDGSVSGHLLLDAAASVGSLAGAPIDPTSTAVRQLSEASDFLRDLPESGWPPTTRVVSIGARDDLVVASHQTRLDPSAARSTVVALGGRGNDHARLPGSPEATTEIARAVGGQAPTCRSLAATLFDEAISRRQADQQDRLGVALAGAGLYVDARTRAAGTDALRR